MNEPVLHIRPAQASDAAEITRLVRELAASSGENSPVSAEYAEQYLAFPGSGVLLALHGEHAAGMLSYSCRPNLYHAGICCDIEELVVDEGARGQGIGSALVLAMMKQLPAMGCVELSVTVMPDNRGAQQFYRAHGLVDEAVYLEKHLPGAEVGRVFRLFHQGLQ